jgi:hypothetical protein
MLRWKQAADAELAYPLSGVRVAVIAEGIACAGEARQFSDLEADDWRDFDPDAVAAPVGDLLRLAGSVDAAEFRAPLVAFTGPVYGALTQLEREILWKRFRVPIFEQLRGLNNELLAFECAAHDGLHVNEKQAVIEMDGGEILYSWFGDGRLFPAPVRTGLTGRLEQGLCGCNHLGMRLFDLRPLRKAQAVAARTARSVAQQLQNSGAWLHVTRKAP